MSSFDETSRKDSDNVFVPVYEDTDTDIEGSDLFGSTRLSLLAKRASFMGDNP